MYIGAHANVDNKEHEPEHIQAGIVSFIKKLQLVLRSLEPQWPSQMTVYMFEQVDISTTCKITRNVGACIHTTRLDDVHEAVNPSSAIVLSDVKDISM